MQNHDDFTTGSIPKKLFRFMIPILGALLLQAMYGAVDLLVVGQFGSNVGVSAVSTGSNIIQIITFLITGLTMGLTVIISRYIGEKRQDRVGAALGSAICFFVVFAIFLTLFLLFAARLMAAALNTPQEAFDKTVQYVRICGGGIVFVVAYNVISGIFRGLGNSRLPLLFVAIACVVNIIADLLFVAVLDMDVAGAAFATILAQAVSVILSLIILSRKKDLPIHISRSDIRFSSEIRLFLRVGLPIALQDLLGNISFLILFSIINSMGLAASSGYGVAQKLVAFIMLIPSALMQSLSAFIAQNVGAGLERRAKKALFTGMGIGAAIGFFIFLLVYFQGAVPSAIFTNNPEYIAKSAEYLKGFSYEAVLTCIVFSFVGYFNGHGRTMFVMIQSLMQAFIIRVPLSYLFSIQPGCTLTSIGLAVPLASTFGILLFTLYYIYCSQKGELHGTD